jgi:hypothetical protein
MLPSFEAFLSQTGSGKSHTSFSSDGPVAQTISTLFTTIDNNYEKDLSYEVDVSMLEMCNREDIRDLMLLLDEQTPLALQQHDSIGVYIEGQSFLKK